MGALDFTAHGIFAAEMGRDGVDEATTCYNISSMVESYCFGGPRSEEAATGAAKRIVAARINYLFSCDIFRYFRHRAGKSGFRRSLCCPVQFICGAARRRGESGSGDFSCSSRPRV